MSSESTNAKKLPRRWMRFSLSSILLVITVFGLWLGIRVNRARNEKTARQDFSQLGAWVQFTYQKKNEWDWDWEGKVKSGVPRWVIEALGEEFFHQIGNVSFHECKVSTRQLELLSRLSALESLSLQGQSHLGDDDLEYIENLSSLENLCLWDMQVTNIGLARLKKLTSLRGLGLSRTKITDDGLVELSKFENLKILELDGTDVSEEGVKRLRQALPDCEIRY